MLKLTDTKKATLKELIGFDDRLFIVIGCPVIAFLVPVLFFDVDPLEKGDMFYAKWLISLTHAILYWVSIRQLFKYMRRRYPTHGETRKRLLYTLLCFVPIYLLINVLVAAIHLSLGFSHEKDMPGVTEMDLQVASITIILLVSSFYESAFLYARWKESIVETEQLKRENVESQLASLRNQVNPHFLFNSLNTLSYLIPEDSERAVKFVEKMARVYRYVLEHRDARLIPVREEIQFLEAYLFLIKERFGENIKVDIALTEHTMNQLIIPLSMQLLFENAIKHNIISASKPLSVQVYEQNGHLLVRNGLQKKEQQMVSTQVGLQNIRNRYAFFTETQVEITETDTYFEVALPLLTT